MRSAMVVVLIFGFAACRFDLPEPAVPMQCTSSVEDDVCAGLTPVCGSDNTCRGCAAHSECSSSTCLPDGACADPGQVAYVEPAPGGTDNAMCTSAMPCTVIAKALATGPALSQAQGHHE